LEKVLGRCIVEIRRKGGSLKGDQGNVILRGKNDRKNFSLEISSIFAASNKVK
jgi:hypothetical protein